VIVRKDIGEELFFQIFNKCSYCDSNSTENNRAKFLGWSATGAYARGYKAIYIHKMVMNCTSKGQDCKCDKFPSGKIHNLS